jgi:hypothetical protein
MTAPALDGLLPEHGDALMAWREEVDWGDVPERMRPGIVRYVEHGTPPGNFLQAILKNDLVDAARRADDENAEILPSYALLMLRSLPAACWGSRADYDAWIARGGLVGIGEETV